jgi:ketosteroid isomerase-like protein
MRVAAICASLLCAGSLMGAQFVCRSRPLQAAPAERYDPEVDTLRALAFRMADLLRRRDAEGALSLYGDTARFVHVENGEVIPWERLSTMMRTYLATVDSNPVSIVGNPVVLVLNRTAAVVYLTHRFGGARGHDGVWTGVLRRESEGWKIVHSHSSDRRPDTVPSP